MPIDFLLAMIGTSLDFDADSGGMGLPNIDGYGIARHMTREAWGQEDKRDGAAAGFQRI